MGPQALAAASRRPCHGGFACPTEYDAAVEAVKMPRPSTGGDGLIRQPARTQLGG